MGFLNEKFAWALTRIILGWVFFWAFIDKMFGLGFKTCLDVKSGNVDYMCAKAWINGGSATKGFLMNSVKGPFAEFYKSIAGHPLVEWLFILGLLGIGVALILGIATRIASYSGIVMMLLMYFALIPPDNNPIIDEHIVYAFVLFGFALSSPGETLGLGRWWNEKVGSKFALLK